MNIWKRLRHKIDIPTNEIANLLHIPEKKYIEIESSVRQMPRRLIDNFMKIYNERKQIKSETQIKMFEVNQFLKTMDLKELRKEFNYTSNKELAKAMGIGEAMIYRLKSNLNAISDNTKIKVYNFFNDPLNIQIDKTNNTDEKQIVNAISKTRVFKTRLSIADTMNITKKAIEKLKCTQIELAQKINMTPGTICRYISGENSMSKDTENRILELIKQNEENSDTGVVLSIDNPSIIRGTIDDNETEDINDIVSDVQESNIEENDTIQKLRELVDELNAENIRLRKTISRYEKLIDRL